jgi:hypothetical protein
MLQKIDVDEARSRQTLKEIQFSVIKMIFIVCWLLEFGMVLGLLWTIILIIVVIIIIVVLLKLVFAIIAIGPYAVYDDAHQDAVNAYNLLRPLTHT